MKLSNLKPNNLSGYVQLTAALVTLSSILPPIIAFLFGKVDFIDAIISICILFTALVILTIMPAILYLNKHWDRISISEDNTVAIESHLKGAISDYASLIQVDEEKLRANYMNFGRKTVWGDLEDGTTPDGRYVVDFKPRLKIVATQSSQNEYKPYEKKIAWKKGEGVCGKCLATTNILFFNRSEIDNQQQPNYNLQNRAKHRALTEEVEGIISFPINDQDGDLLGVASIDTLDTDVANKMTNNISRNGNLDEWRNSMDPNYRDGLHQIRDDWLLQIPTNL